MFLPIVARGIVSPSMAPCHSAGHQCISSPFANTQNNIHIATNGSKNWKTSHFFFDLLYQTTSMIQNGATWHVLVTKDAFHGNTKLWVWWQYLTKSEVTLRTPDHGMHPGAITKFCNINTWTHRQDSQPHFQVCAWTQTITLVKEHQKKCPSESGALWKQTLLTAWSLHLPGERVARSTLVFLDSGLLNLERSERVGSWTYIEIECRL